MKLLLDEMLSPAIARELRARGHDVESITGHPDRETLPDPEVMALARAEHRAVVTDNLRDYRPLHNDAIIPGCPGDYGMIFMPGTYRRTKSDAGHGSHCGGNGGQDFEKYPRQANALRRP